MNELKRQMQAVADWQKRLLPSTLPQPSGWRIAAHYAVGTWPGGDYYDVLELPDARLFLFIADASDQGAPSSALVGMVRVVLHSCPLSSGSERLPFCPMQGAIIQPPHILLGHLNRVLAENSLEEQFLTAFCAVLNPADGALHYASAGQPAPRWWRASAGVVESLVEPSGLPLGIDAHASYHHRRVEMEPGDLLVLYSDGLTAVLNGQGVSFGRDRLDTVIKAMADDGAGAVTSSIVASLEKFRGGREMTDDVAILVVERCE